jgi:DNA topoisomerase-3
VCRSESDWLVGINGTRAMTAFNSKEGGFYKTTVGRVQTPTLAILVEREERIRSFKPRDYWEIHATFVAAAGEYAGRWFDEKFQKPAEDGEARAERLWDERQATGIRDRCLGKPGIATEESKPASQLSPLLYDLTSLQREANGRFGFSARTTLSLAQALYEKHKALTYPRTDSRALPEDYLGTVKKTLDVFATQKVLGYAPHAAKILKQGWVKLNRRIFDNKKISDHFAIIPTMQPPRHLSEAERKLYDLVVKRFLAVFFPAAEYLVTTRITRVEGEAFKTEGRVMTEAGWLAVYGKDAETSESASLVAIKNGEKVQTREIEVRANQTKPPARFTEATLLSAMEGAGKLVEDEDLREAMSEKGLGTPATRAQIIEGLIYEDYVHRVGRDLHPTPKASSLLFALRHFGVNELCSPELTGNWEFKLKQMEHGTLERSAFMDHIVDLTREMVSRIKRGDIPDTAFLTLSTPCPKCGGKVNETYRKFKCTKCDFSIWKVVSSREFAPEEIETLIEKKSVGPLTGFRSRMGKPFAAVVRLTPEFRAEFDFGRPEEGEGAAKVDFTGLTPLGPCPKCGGRVFEQPMAYVCENGVNANRTCDFRSGRVILQRPIEREEIQKLLATGRTDLLHRFISRKGRPFSAFLVRGADGKVGFEFAPRAAKRPAPAQDKEPAPEPAKKKKGQAKPRAKRTARKAA